MIGKFKFWRFESPICGRPRFLALHILFDEYEEHKKRNKGRTDEKHRSILHYTNAALEMCYKIRDNKWASFFQIITLTCIFSASTNLGASKSTFEKLSALGYKCEARLSLLYYKMNQGQHDYMRLHKDLTDVLQQKVPPSVESNKNWSSSSVGTVHPNESGPLRIEGAHSFGERIPKLENVSLWQPVAPEGAREVGQRNKSSNKGKPQIHFSHCCKKEGFGTHRWFQNPGFFDVIGRLTEIRHLHLMCSLKDLSTFQSAAVKELRHRELHLGTSDASPLSWPPSTIYLWKGKRSKFHWEIKDPHMDILLNQVLSVILAIFRLRVSTVFVFSPVTTFGCTSFIFILFLDFLLQKEGPLGRHNSFLSSFFNNTRTVKGLPWHLHPLAVLFSFTLSPDRPLLIDSKLYHFVTVYLNLLFRVFDLRRYLAINQTFPLYFTRFFHHSKSRKIIKVSKFEYRAVDP